MHSGDAKNCQLSTKIALDNVPQSKCRCLVQKYSQSNLPHGKKTRAPEKISPLPFMQRTHAITAAILATAAFGLIALSSFLLLKTQPRNIAYSLHGRFLYINHQSGRTLRQSILEAEPVWYSKELVESILICDCYGAS